MSYTRKNLGLNMYDDTTERGIELTRSEFIEAAFMLDGHPFRFKNYPFYKDIYDRMHRRLLLKCGRQVAKSTTIVNMTLADAMAIPHYRVLYVSPTMNQTSVWSKTRLQKTINHSPLIRDNFTTSALPLGVWMKEFTNGSELHMSYASDDPDRIRGITTDDNKYDEVQDIILELVVPVVNETMAVSKYAREMYCGTPKSMENGIEWMWAKSTQNEWIVQCEGCNKYNAILTAKSIGLKGVICVRCGKYLQVRNGFWHAMNIAEDEKERALQMDGYHISQLILPLNNEVPEYWQRLLGKLASYDDIRFMNEVLGLSTAEGTRFIEREDLLKQCRDYQVEFPPRESIFDDIRVDVQGRYEIYAGVDWSGGGITGVSRTVIWVWGILPNGALKTLYFKIFQSREPFRDVQEIADICSKLRVKMIGADAGVGAHANSFLREYFGENRVFAFQYGAFQRQFSKGIDRVFIDRTSVIDSYMSMVKREELFFPHRDQCKVPFDDVMSMYTETTQQGRGRRVWTKSPAQSDDCLHAQLFGWVVADIAMGKLVLYGTPKQREGLAGVTNSV